MSPRVRYLSTTVALVALAAAYVFWPGRLERPRPRIPVVSGPAMRLAALPPAPPIARDLLARVVALDLRPDQAARLEALDRAWEREAEGLEEALREAERDFSSFMKDAQATRGASVQEIQRRSAEYSQLSATLRERRRRHADAALAVLVGWQRDRLAHEGRPDVGRDR